MKSLVLALAILGSAANAAGNQCDGINSTEKASDQNCADVSQKYVAKKLGVKLEKVKFFNGAMVGDGADTIEIDMYQVEGTQGLYKVELYGEECQTRSMQLIN